MDLKDFFDFQTDLGSAYIPLIKDSTQSVETNKRTKVHWLKARHIKCVPTTTNNISIGVRYDVSSAFTNVIVANLPKETETAGRRELSLPQLNKESLPVSKALLKVRFIIHLIKVS